MSGFAIGLLSFPIMLALICLRIPIGVGLSVLLLGESVPTNLALGLVLVMAGVAAMTIPADRYGKWINRLRSR